MLLLVALSLALLSSNRCLPDCTQVLSGTLGTGPDLFMGCVLGPALRRSTISQLVPRRGASGGGLSADLADERAGAMARPRPP